MTGNNYNLLFMNMCLAMMGMSGGELVIVLVGVLVLFGAKRIPDFAKGLGQGIREFKKASSGVTDEIHNAMNQELPQRASPRPLQSSESTVAAAIVPKS
jgi:sec-independent protein translocase protein TatA